MNNPVWIDEKGKIIEPEYCRDFLSRHPMRCINDRFYTVDGPLPDENKLKRTIYVYPTRSFRQGCGLAVLHSREVSSGDLPAITILRGVIQHDQRRNDEPAL